MIHPRIGRRLSDAALEPKDFHLVEGAHHGNVPRVGGAFYLARWERFFDEVASRP